MLNASTHSKPYFQFCINVLIFFSFFFFYRLLSQNLKLKDLQTTRKCITLYFSLDLKTSELGKKN